MLAIERQRFIEEWAKSHGEVPICTLAKELNVSVETIRRDVRAEYFKEGTWWRRSLKENAA